jgi:hypothetical protein
MLFSRKFVSVYVYSGVWYYSNYITNVLIFITVATFAIVAFV